MGGCCCIHLDNCTKMSLPLGLEQGLKNLITALVFIRFLTNFASISLDLIYSWPRLFKSWIALSTG